MLRFVPCNLSQFEARGAARLIQRNLKEIYARILQS